MFLGNKGRGNGQAASCAVAGYDMDKNVITRIETNKRYVTDIELKALCEVFHITYAELIDGKDAKKN